ncbi:hypothetical protein K474DRAFT_700972 [Panus rudis PR-1116 ss-1]|nr:hypothetical protein K474DRAFT_700972 [Panus rudis PR-1116 ss-1]
MMVYKYLISPTILIAICAMIPPSHTASWFGKSSEYDTPRKPTRAAVSRYPHPSDAIGELTRNLHQLDEHARRPDCFIQVSGAIRTRCADLEMDEDERVAASVSMTLCELATAKHSPPLECERFVGGLSSSANTASREQKSCVEALSRSAQYWSSYSGYLREVPQLCFAYRRWHDIDTARETYRNATLEKIAFLKFLQHQERDNQKHHEQTGIIFEQIRSLLSTMETAATSLEDVSRRSAERIQTQSSHVLATFRQGMEAMQEVSMSHVRQSLAQLDSQLLSVAEKHSSSLETLLLPVSDSIHNHLELLLAEARRQADISAEFNRLAESARRFHEYAKDHRLVDF